MLKFHSTGVLGTSKAEVFFPNKKGVSILRTKKSGHADSFRATMLVGTEEDHDIDLSTTLHTDEVSKCDEMLDKVRILSSD